MAGYRCNIDDTAVCFVDYCSMLTRVLCVLFFFCCRRDRSAKKLVVVLSALGRHTHIAQHAPRAHCTLPPDGAIDSLRMTAVYHRSHTPSSSSSRAAALTRSPSAIYFFLNPHLPSQPLVCSCFVCSNFLEFYFNFKSQIFLFGISQAVSKPILFGQSE